MLSRPIIFDFTIFILWCWRYNHLHYFILFYQLDQLKSRLNKVWPSLKLKVNNSQFWNDEWKKHGTCSTMRPKPYFKLALDLYALNDIKDLLNKTLTPGGLATKAAIESAIKLGTGSKPQLHCDKNSRNLLEEVRLCFNITNRYISCPTGTNCRDTIHLPKVTK
jgi:ribonuclease T2